METLKHTIKFFTRFFNILFHVCLDDLAKAKETMLKERLMNKSLQK